MHQILTTEYHKPIQLTEQEIAAKYRATRQREFRRKNLKALKHESDLQERP